jgi:glutamate/tyrosine decarboxylase-like PLP-dependent enzyme
VTRNRQRVALDATPTGVGLDAIAHPPATRDSAPMSTPGSRALLHDVADRAARYLESLPERKVRPDPIAVAGLERLRRPLPDHASPADEVIRELDELCSPATMAMAGPRFFGFVIGGALPVTIGAGWLATAWDQNTGLFQPTPATAAIESVALDWLVDLLGLPAGTGGGFVTGATVANFTALAAARHAVLERAGWNVEAHGLFGAPPIHVLVGEEAHPTLLKSLGLLGLGRARLTRVPVDGQGRMRPDALVLPNGPTIVCAQAGNVNTGAFDPLDAIAERTRKAGAWLHVDGAFGLWAAASPKLRALTQGLELVDSCATDAHKSLNVPYDSGLAFVRDPRPLAAAMAITADYLPTDTPQRNPSDFTPELSRRARGVEVWAALRALGRSGVAELIEGFVRHAQRFASKLSAAGYEVLNDVVFNQVLVSFGDPAATARTIAAVQAEGTCWAGPTVWQGRHAMRLSICGWSTTEADVDRSVESIVRAARG